MPTKSSIQALVFPALLLGFVSCKKENKIPILNITPISRDISVASGNVVSFDLVAQSDNSTLSRLIITSKRVNGFTTTLVDSTLSGSTFSWRWEYLAVHYTEDYVDQITFTVEDANGAKMSTYRKLHVVLGTVVLTETTGHIFYSPSSGTHFESAFDLEERVRVVYNVDSTRRDIQDTTDTGDVLSRSWISPAGGRFVRYNEFDYANATDISVHNAFNTGVPTEQLNNIAVGDIIITRLGSQEPNIGFYAVVRIMDIVDESGTADNDHYVFNMKWVSFVE